jgi:hypothetical protein
LILSSLNTWNRARADEAITQLVAVRHTGVCCNDELGGAWIWVAGSEITGRGETRASIPLDAIYLPRNTPIFAN